MPLSQVTLKGFKSIRAMDLKLGDINVLLGPNGAGKSNLLSFFRMLNALGEGRLQLFVGEQGGANALLHYGRKRTPQLEATMVFDGPNGTNTYAMTLVGVAPDALMFSEERVSYTPKGGREKSNVLGGGHRESQLSVMAGSDATARTVKWNVDRWRVYHFHDTSSAAPIKLSRTVRCGSSRFRPSSCSPENSKIVHKSS